MAQATVTQVGAYAELEGAAATVTQVGAYADLRAWHIQDTQFGAYAEIVGAAVHSTQVGAYLEIMLCYTYPRIWYGNTEITQWVHKFSLQVAINQIEVRSLATPDNAMHTISGTPKWRLPIQGFWAATFDDTTMPDFIVSDSDRVRIDVWRYCRMVSYRWITAYIVRAGIMGETTNAIAWDYELVLSGAPARLRIGEI